MKQFFDNKEIKDFFRSGILITISSVIVGILGYLFQIVIGRMIEPVNFAVFTGLIAIYSFLASPFAALNLFIVKQVAASRFTQQVPSYSSYYLKLHKWIALLSFILILILYLMSDFFMRYLKVQSLSQILILGSLLVFSCLMVINNSFLQGLHLFGRQASFNLFSAFVKLLLGIGFIELGLNVTGALLGVSLSAGLTWIFGFIFLLRIFSNIKDSPELFLEKKKNKPSEIFRILCISLSLTIMTQLDIILVNSFFSPSDAGEYAAASVLGKAVLYISSSLVIVLFPMTINLNSNQLKGSLLLITALICTFIMSGILALIYFIWGNEIINLIYGSAYEGAGKILRWYGIAVLPVALVIVFEHYLIAKGLLIFSFAFLIITPLQVMVIYIWHDNIYYVLAALGISGLIILLIGSFISYQYLTHNRLILFKKF